MMDNFKKYPWVLVGLLWVVAVLNYMDRQMLSTMKMAIEVDIFELRSATYFGNLMAVFLWVYGLMSPFSGIIADRYNRKWLIIGSLGTWSLITLLTGYATSYNQLYVLRALMGLAEALYLPAALSLIADFHGSKTRSLAVAIHMTGFYLGQAIGGFGVILANILSWNLAFKSVGLFGVIYSLILILFLKEKSNDTTSHQIENSLEEQKNKDSLFKGVGLLMGNISFWIILFYFAVPSLPGWATKNWLPTLFSENLNIDMEYAGPLSMITLTASSFIGVIFGGILSDKWVQKNIKGRIYTGTIGLALTIPSLLIIGFDGNIIYVVAATLCFGFGYGMFDANNMPILCQFVSRKYRATAYGIMNLTGILAGAFITNFLGRSTDTGNLGRDFALLSGIVLVAIIIQLRYLKPTVGDFVDSNE